MTHLHALLAAVLLAATHASQVPYRQEDMARFDAPTTPLGRLGAYQAPFETLADLDFDGVPDFVRTMALPQSGTMRIQVDLNLNDGGGMPAHVGSVLQHFGWGFQCAPALDPEAHPHALVADLMPPAGRPDILVVYGRELSLARNFVRGYAVRSLQAPEEVRAAAVGDLDGQGYAEIAVLLSDRIVVHVWNGAAWSGQELPLPSDDWRHLEVGEFTGDGHLDLLVVGARLALVRSLVDGGHAQGVAREEHALFAPDPGVGDIDGDGDDDVVLFSPAEYRILRQVRPGRLVPEAPRAGGPATGLADIDGDGDLDGVCCGGGGGTTWPGNEKRSRFELSLNRDGHGDFAPAFALQGLGAYHLAGAADVDQDGDVDLVAGRAIYYAPGKIVPPVTLPTPLEPNAMGDVDGDGDVDLGFGLAGFQANRGDGSLEPRALVLPTPPPGSEYRGPGFPGDFDGDGTLDLLVERWSNGLFQDVRLLANAGAGSFTDAHAAMTPAQPFSALTELRAEAAFVADIDGDRDLDLVVRNVGAHARFSWLWFNRGQGRFVEGPLWNGERVLALAHLDSQLQADLVVGGDGLRYRRGLGAGAFDAPLYFPSMGAGYRIDSDADFDAERDRVAVWSPASGRDVLWAPGRPGVGPYSVPFLCHLTPSEAYTAGTLYREASSGSMDFPFRILGGDLDANGRIGEFETLSGPYEQTPGAYIGSFPSGYWCCTSQIFEPLALADMDGDGDEDALGERLWLNRSIEGPAAGRRLQFGQATAGSGAVLPVLGVRAPLSAGNTLTLCIRGAVGGADATLAIAAAVRELADWPAFGVTSYVDTLDSSFRTYALRLQGNPGEPGTGSLEIPFQVPSAYAGTTQYLQVLIEDPQALGGKSATNALRIDYGE